MQTHYKLHAIKTLATLGTDYSAFGDTMFDAIKSVVHLDDPAPAPLPTYDNPFIRSAQEIEEHFKIPTAEELQDHSQQGSIAAIKKYRARTGSTCEEAKKAIEAEAKRLGIPNAYTVIEKRSAGERRVMAIGDLLAIIDRLKDSGSYKLSLSTPEWGQIDEARRALDPCYIPF